MTQEISPQPLIMTFIQHPTIKNAKRHTDNIPIDNTTANNSPTTSYNKNL